MKCVKINNIDDSAIEGYKDEVPLLCKFRREDRIAHLYQHAIVKSEKMIYMVGLGTKICWMKERLTDTFVQVLELGRSILSMCWRSAKINLQIITLYDIIGIK